MLSRKDYVITAQILNGNRYFVNEDVFETMVNEFADYFANNNPRFNRAKFKSACNGGK